MNINTILPERSKFRTSPRGHSGSPSLTIRSDQLQEQEQYHAGASLPRELFNPRLRIKLYTAHAQFSEAILLSASLASEY